MAPSGIQSQRLCSGGQLRGSWGLGHWGLRLTGPGSYPWLRSWLSSELAWRPRMLRGGPLCIWLPAAATAPWCSSSLRLARTSTAMMVLEVLPPKQLPCLNNPLSFLCATAALPSMQIETSCEPAVCGYRETWNVITACQISWQEAGFSCRSCSNGCLHGYMPHTASLGRFCCMSRAGHGEGACNLCFSASCDMPVELLSCQEGAACVTRS